MKIRLEPGKCVVFLILMLFLTGVLDFSHAAVRISNQYKCEYFVPPMNLKMSNSYDISRNGYLYVTIDKKNILEIFNNVFILDEHDSSIGDIAFSKDGGLFVINNDNLGVYDQRRYVVRKGISLPVEGMRIFVFDEDTIYLYGGNEEEEASNTVLQLKINGEYAIVLVADARITGFARVGDVFFFSTSEKIFTTMVGQEIKLMFYHPSCCSITSIAVTPELDAYFSADNRIFELDRDGNLSTVVENCTGRLKWRDSALFVLDESRNAVVRLKRLGPRSNGLALHEVGQRKKGSVINRFPVTVGLLWTLLVVYVLFSLSFTPFFLGRKIFNHWKGMRK